MKKTPSVIMIKPVREFKEEQVIRYIDSILVWGKQIEVRFKAGVSILLPLK